MVNQTETSSNEDRSSAAAILDPFSSPILAFFPLSDVEVFLSADDDGLYDWHPNYFVTLLIVAD